MDMLSGATGHDTIIAAFAAIAGLLGVYVRSVIGSLSKTQEKAIEKLDVVAERQAGVIATITANFSAIHAQIDALSARVDTLSARVDRMEARLGFHIKNDVPSDD